LHARFLCAYWGITLDKQVMLMTSNDNNEPLRSWRTNDWLREAGFPFSRPTLYAEIKAGRIKVRKAGIRNTLIVTSPREYLASLPEGIGPPVGRARKRVAS
jgi:hypothetical protein